MIEGTQKSSTEGQPSFPVDIQFDQVGPKPDLEQTAYSVTIEDSRTHGKRFRFVEGISPSSASKDSENELKNMLTVTNKSGEVTIRSARTISEDAVLKLAAAMALHNQQSKEPLDFAITSALDGLTPKLEFFGQAITIPGVENEETFFSELLQAVDEIWKDNGPIELRFIHNGVEQSQKINKPLVLNLVLSNTAHKSKATQAARKHNRQQLAHLQEKLFKKYEKDIQKTFKVNQESPRNRKIHALATHALHTGNYSLKFATRALELLETNHLTSAHDGLKECLLNHFLMKELNIAENFQCKSGQDRTPAMLFMCQAAELMIDAYRTDIFGETFSEGTVSQNDRILLANLIKPQPPYQAEYF